MAVDCSSKPINTMLVKMCVLTWHKKKINASCYEKITCYE